MSYAYGGSLGGAASAYKSSRVMSSTPVDLIVMLHERLLADLKGGALAIEAENIEAKAVRLQSAYDVIYELMASLDREAGGEISQRLAALYSYMISRIREASRALDPEPLSEVAAHVESLLSAWSTLAAESRESPPLSGE